MALFNFGKKKKAKENTSADCSCRCDSHTGEGKVERKCCCGNKNDSISSIKVLGSGCRNCHTLYENAKEAVKEMGISIEVEYVTDMQKIMEYGVMSMPALVVNEKPVSIGRVLKAGDIAALLNKGEF